MAEAGKSLPVTATTTLVAVLTAGTTWAGKCQVVSLRAANKSGADTWFSVAITRSSTTTYLVFHRSIEVEGVYAETLHCILQVGDVISVQAGANTAVDLLFSGYEGVD